MEQAKAIKVRAGVLQGADELVRELGGNPAEVARLAGASRRLLANPDAPIPVPWVIGYLQQAALHCGCPHFGLLLGPRQSLTLFGALAPLLESATTLGELVRDIAAYFPLHTRGAQVSLVAERGGIAVCYDAMAGIGESQRQLIELGLAVLVSELRRQCPTWQPREVWLRHSPPPGLAPYRRIMGCTPQFNADRNALFLPRELLQHPALSGDPGLHGSLESRFDQARRSQAEAVVTRAEIVVRALLPFAPCDLAATARMMRLSRRTLQRRLAALGDSFEQVVDRVRADLARSYLTDSDLSVAQIAEILQFSETSALSRACRRWYGASPRQLRQSH